MKDQCLEHDSCVLASDAFFSFIFNWSSRDTAGQERFNSLTQMFLKGSDMVLLVFDLTRSDSFESLAMWRDQFLASTRNDGETFPMALVAAKSDMAIHRAVSQKRANTSVKRKKERNRDLQ